MVCQRPFAELITYWGIEMIESSSPAFVPNVAIEALKCKPAKGHVLLEDIKHHDLVRF